MFMDSMILIIADCLVYLESGPLVMLLQLSQDYPRKSLKNEHTIDWQNYKKTLLSQIELLNAKEVTLNLLDMVVLARNLC
jgi:hypothetical protein